MAQINMIFNGVDNVSAVVSAINRQMQKAEKKAETLSSKLMGISSALNIMSTAKSMIGGLTSSVGGLVAEYQHELEMETRLSTVMQARFGATSEMVQSVKDTLHAQESATGYSYEMLTNGAQELATYISDAETLKGLMPVLANMAKQAGVNSEQGMMSYATMLGKVMGGDMGGMSKRGYVFSDAEKEAFKLMNEEERLAFITQTVTSSIGDQANALNALNPQSVQSISNALGDTRKELGKTLKPFLEFFQLVTMKWKIGFYETMNNALQWIQKHINGVIIALGALGVSVLAVAGYFVILQKKAIASAFATAIAWMIAHAQMAIVIGIILLIIGALALFLAFSDKTFTAVGRIIGSLVSFVMNLFGNLWNFIVDFAEFFANVFIDPVGAIGRLFINVFDKILSVIQNVAGAIGAIFGQDWSSGIENFRTSLEEFKNEKLGESKISLDNIRYQERSNLEFANKGGAIGKSLSDKFQGAINSLTGKLKGEVSGGVELGDVELGVAKDVELGVAKGMNDTAIGNMKIGSNGALLTKNVDEVDIAQDYKDLLSTKATEKFFFKQSNIRPEINIEMNGTNVTAEDVRDKVASLIGEMTNTMTEGLYGVA